MTPKVFGMRFSSAYLLLVDKVERKRKTKAQPDEIMDWLTGHDAQGLAAALEDGRDVESFSDQAPAKNPNRAFIKAGSAASELTKSRPDHVRDPRP